MNLVSTTPLMEYMDMLYTRLAIEMPKHLEVVQWHVEVHPPVASGLGVGTIKLVALKRTAPKSLKVSYTATMDAIERGASVSVQVLETVVDHHIKKFVDGIHNDS